MKHITNILVHSNRCEVTDGHIYTVGDKGLPHIKLKFIYMFDTLSLRSKKLECKYLLPNGKYWIETVIINSKDEVLFQIHHSCFSVNGWTTLRITLVNGDDRITLDDIIIKTKETKLGEKFSNVVVEEAISNAINITTKSVRTEGESIKEELKEFSENEKVKLSNYISQKKTKLKGEQGPRGETGPRGERGAKPIFELDSAGNLYVDYEE